MTLVVTFRVEPSNPLAYMEIALLLVAACNDRKVGSYFQRLCFCFGLEYSPYGSQKKGTRAKMYGFPPTNSIPIAHVYQSR